MGASTHDEITTQAQAALRRNAATVVGGVAGASVMALLAVASTAPLLAGGLAPAAVVAWVAGLGGNALASWLDEWARSKLASYEGHDTEDEARLVEDLARDLSRQLALSKEIAADTEQLVQRTDAIQVALGALCGQGEQQLRLLQALTVDLQASKVENRQLHNVSFSAVRQQAQTILAALTQGDAALGAQLRELIAAVQRMEARASSPAPSHISIGSVGTLQQITISGGSVDSIIGSQHTAATATALSIPASFVRPATTFIGRTPLLAELCAQLCERPGMRLALYGKPGVGKSRLALEIVADPAVRGYFTGGLLVARLGVQGNTELELRRWSADLGLADDPKLSVAEHVARLNRLISADERPWLVIVDDVWRADQLRPFLTFSDQVRLLITTRQRDQLLKLGEYLAPDSMIELAVLEHPAAMALLGETAGFAQTDFAAEIDLLARLVGGLPLLLTVMGNYLRAQGAGQPDWFARALADLKNAAVRLNLPVATLEAAQAHTTQRGWLTRLFARKPTATQPLSPRVIISLSVHALPRAEQHTFLALAAFPPDPASFDVATGSIVAERRASELERTLRLLCQRSLLDSDMPGRFRMHHVLWDWAEQSDQRAVTAARQRLRRWHSDILAQGQQEAFAVWRSHPDNWAQMLETWEAAIHDPEALALCLRTILPALISQGYWNAVLEGLERALEIFRNVPSRQREVALVRYYLGNVYYYRAEYALAERHTAEAHAAFQVMHYPNGQGAAVNQLGGIHQALGNYSSARACFEEALTLTPATDERNYAGCLSNLAGLLKEFGDYAAARPLVERALAIHEQALGPHHPSTATSLNNLAELLKSVGEYAAARQMFERALAIYEQALGPSHPETAASLNNLAMLLKSMGDYAAARQMLERALAICEQALGPSHPVTATSLNNLAGLFNAVGDYAAARPLLERALAVLEQALGPNHPHTRQCRQNLANIERQLAGASMPPSPEE